MAANDKQFDPNPDGLGRQRPDILRAKDIIPGARHNKTENGSGSDIPQFNLARDIMASHRQITASRRKSPSSANDGTEPIAARWAMDKTTETLHSEWNPIIADIVTRDIERLCGNGS